MNARFCSPEAAPRSPAGLARLIARLLACLFALSLACLPLAATAQTADWPRTILHETGDLVLNTPPQRIVSTSPSLTGTLLAIKAPLVATATAMGGRLTDTTGFFNQWAKVAQDQGVIPLYTDLEFDIESLILSDPDLVIASATGGDSILPFVPELESLGYPVLVLDYSVNAWEDLARKLGQATDRTAEAEAVIADFTRQAEQARTHITRPEGTVSIVSYNFFGTYGVSKPQSTQARVLLEMGFTVTGLPAAMGPLVTRSREFDFVSHENLPASITGDSIFLLAADAADVKTFVADPVLANLPAVKQGRVYPLGPSSFRVDYYSGLEMIDAVTGLFAK
nr:Fe2+-enterobactin ABC transporter substrate-binding protein [Amylibacter sp.]